MSEPTDAEDLLVELYNSGSPFLDDYEWEFEHDRWLELILCALTAGLGVDPALARNIVEGLDHEEFLNPETLAVLSEEDRSAISTLLNRKGLSKEDTAEIVDTLQALGKRTNDRWGGYIQRFLRSHGETMAREMSADLIKCGLKERPALKAATLWLQRVANIPALLQDDPHVEMFCDRFGYSAEILVEAADRRGLNISILDDLLALEAIAGEGSDNEKEERSAELVA